MLKSKGPVKETCTGLKLIYAYTYEDFSPS